MVARCAQINHPYAAHAGHPSAHMLLLLQNHISMRMDGCWQCLSFQRPIIIMGRVIAVLSRHFAQVPCEPVWASRAGRICVPAWEAMLSAAECLIQRVAALEILLEENYQVVRSGYLSKHFGRDPLPLLRQVCGQAAEQCDHMGAVIEARSLGQQVMHPLIATSFCTIIFQL